MLKTDVHRGRAEGCGFTLAEVMMVVVIIALISGFGVGIWAGTHSHIQVKKGAREFLLAARYANIRSIETGRVCRLELSSENNSFDLLSYTFDEQGDETRLEPVRDPYFNKAIRLDEDVRFELIRIGRRGRLEDTERGERRTIFFSPNGTAREAVIQIGDGESHYTVTVNAATGKAKMHYSTADKVKSATIDLDKGESLE